ncbi:glycosyl hydrolase 108 family protein [Cytophagaceae bacterium YF14B1]|uniref:Glycosyl hydrolase 108 family protein n=1 Tax=Xanthocytophaga flava TaxID=3048013 RepID=A0AAE3QMY1_9BACT|nr:glycosyl hydrolase 108 family protein [Xanthocytophaga flavus]MDJ1480283.1 glycosyl hydrolase 108 family protein [Xanthocytophaga flavus]
MALFEIWYKIVERWEGGYVNDPKDRGGETYKGVTKKFNSTWKGWVIIERYKAEYLKKTGKALPRNWFAPKEDTELELLVQQAAKKSFWDVFKADQIKDQNVANILVDFGWHSGTGTATKLLQGALNIPKTGVFNEYVLTVINNTDGKKLFLAIQKARLDLFDSLVKRDPNQQKFLKGWQNRVNSFIYQ